MGALDGRVVIITGAGNGIGRQHALLFAREGARVVVNDLGCDPHGDGADAGVATRVVEEIKAAGGEAVANTSDVGDWKTGAELVEQALDQFGELHVVVNNAGVLRHMQLADMSENDLDRVLAIHLKGHFSTTHHAGAYWRSRNQAGHEVRAAIVNTASSQGLFGGRNFPQETELPYGIEMAQSNYDAAKGAILSLTLSSSIELLRYGVRTNALCPFATTRLADLYPGSQPLPEEWPGETFAPGHPRQNSYIAAWLATEGCPANGTVWSPSLGIVWNTWTPQGQIPLPERWPTVDEIDRLVSEHVGTDRLSVLGRGSRA